MEWQDEAIVLSATRHGESDAVLEVMTKSHGRSRGFIKGGLGRRNKANLQAGNHVQVAWRARLETNLGRFTVELHHSPLGQMMGDGARLSALAAVTSVVASTMPEHETHTGVYEGLAALIQLLENEDGDSAIWASALARLELGILTELGYGLDLSACAATGQQEDLIYVSPKSAQAVCRESGIPYKEKLLSLPSFLLKGHKIASSKQAAADGLTLTGFFLGRNVWQVQGKGQPAARERLFAALLR